MGVYPSWINRFMCGRNSHCKGISVWNKNLSRFLANFFTFTENSRRDGQEPEPLAGVGLSRASPESITLPSV